MRRLLLAAVLLAAPVAVVSAVLWRHHATLLNCTLNRSDPKYNDESHYWAEVQCFATAGFRGGYFVMNEKTPPLRALHFGPHGPGFPVVYGSLARVLGWGPVSGPLFNLLVVAAGTLIWLALCRPGAGQLGVVAFLVAGFWPLLLFIPATMQESLHFAFAFALAGLASRSIREEGRGAATLAFPVAVALASLVRLTWCLLLPAWALAAFRGNARGRRYALLLTAFLMPLLVWCWGQICAPYPNDMSIMLSHARTNPGEAWHMFWGRLERALDQFGLASYARPDVYRMVALLRVEVLAVIAAGAWYGLGGPWRGRLLTGGLAVALTVLRCEFVGAAVIAAAGVWRERTRKSVAVNVALVGLLWDLHQGSTAATFFGPVLFLVVDLALVTAVVAVNRRVLAEADRWLSGRLGCPDGRGWLFAGLNLALLLFLIVTVYEVSAWRDYRVLGPHLLLSLLVVSAGPAWRGVVVVAMANLLCVSGFVSEFDILNKDRFKPSASEAVDLSQYLAYDPEGSAWDNTVLVPDLRAYSKVVVPAGMGVSCVAERGGEVPLRVELPPKSKYVLTDEGTARLWGEEWQLIGDTAGGKLFLNRNRP